MKNITFVADNHAVRRIGNVGAQFGEMRLRPALILTHDVLRISGMDSKLHLDDGGALAETINTRHLH
jgi:hypothetical protein